MTTLGELLETAVDLQGRIQALQEAYRQVEFAIIQQMDAAGQTEVPHATIVCRLERKPAYAKERLYPLRELLDPTVLAEGYLPEHKETVVMPETWDLRQVLKWARKYGDDVRAVVEAATMPGPPRLHVERKKTA